MRRIETKQIKGKPIKQAIILMMEYKLNSDEKRQVGSLKISSIGEETDETKNLALDVMAEVARQYCDGSATEEQLLEIRDKILVAKGCKVPDSKKVKEPEMAKQKAEPKKVPGPQKDTCTEKKAKKSKQVKQELDYKGPAEQKDPKKLKNKSSPTRR